MSPSRSPTPFALAAPNPAFETRQRTYTPNTCGRLLHPQPTPRPRQTRPPPTPWTRPPQRHPVSGRNHLQGACQGAVRESLAMANAKSSTIWRLNLPPRAHEKARGVTRAERRLQSRNETMLLLTYPLSAWPCRAGTRKYRSGLHRSPPRTDARPRRASRALHRAHPGRSRSP